MIEELKAKAIKNLRNLIAELETWEPELLDYFRTLPEVALACEWLNRPRTDEAALRAEVDDSATQEETFGCWQPIETVPLDEWILAAVKVCDTKSNNSWWEMNMVVIDSETREITHESDAGWGLTAYSHWMPRPAPPQETNALRSKQERTEHE